MFTLKSIFIHSALLTALFSFFTFTLRAKRQSQQRLKNYKAIYDNIWDAILIADLDRRILDCNAAFETLFEYSLPEILGRTTHFIYASPAGFERMGTVLFEATNKTKERVALTYKKKSGQIITCEVEAFPINDEKSGKLIGHIGIFRDITDKKKSELELKKLFKGIEQSPAAVMITDHNGTIEYVNPQFLKITGYTSNEVVGQNPRILQSGRTDLKVYNSLWKALRNGKTWKGEFINQRKNGDTYLFSESISPIKDETNGEITHFIGVGEDITKRRANELKIQQALEEKTVLLSEVHHRVKNNLAIVSGLLEMQSMKTPEVEDILKLSQNRIHSIAQAHELMYQSENFSQIDISDYINKMTGIFKRSFNSEKLNVDIKVEVENVFTER